MALLECSDQDESDAEQQMNLNSLYRWGYSASMLNEAPGLILSEKFPLIN
jgi:hypothetical protein